MAEKVKVITKTKAKYWVGICYPENMVENWKEDIGDILQFPYAYCVHDKDLANDGDEERKVHVHIMVAFNNTTTYNHALKTFDRLSAEGRKCINYCEEVLNVRSKYDYLIHDTETCRKKGKHLYDVSERILGNNFDIGSYEQLSVMDKLNIKKDLANLISEKNFLNFYDMFLYVSNELDSQYLQVFSENQGFYANLIRGYFNKVKLKMTGEETTMRTFLSGTGEFPHIAGVGTIKGLSQKQAESFDLLKVIRNSIEEDTLEKEDIYNLIEGLLNS